MARFTFPIALSLFALLLLGPARAAEPPPPEWKVPSVTKVAVDLATVDDAEPDGPLPTNDRFVVSLKASGRLHFGPAWNYRGGGGDAGTGMLSLSDTQATWTAIKSFATVLRHNAAGEGMRSHGGFSRMRLLIRADRSRRWVEGLWLIEAAAAPSIGVTRLQFAVDKAGAAASTSWRLPYDLPLGDDAAGPSHRTRGVRLVLDSSQDGHPLLTVRETIEDSVGRVLAEFATNGERPLDLQAAAKALHAYRVEGSRELGPALLVATLALTEGGASRWRFADALPLFSMLRSLGAQVHLLHAPPLPPTPAETPVKSRRGPFSEPPTRYTRQMQRWARAVDEALRWLTAHQSPDGRWEAAGFGAWCDGEDVEGQQPDGAGLAEHDVGVTGLALLAFLGAGHTPRGEHPYADVVRRGLLSLRRAQDNEGCFGPRKGGHWIYNHGAATWAMVEAAALSDSPKFRASAQRGLDFIAMCRNPYFAWRYGVKPGDNDTSVTGWMFMPIALARSVNASQKERGLPPAFVVDEESTDGVRAWLDKMTDPGYGRVGYIQRGGAPARPQALIDKFPGDKSESMTGLGITLRVELGEEPRKSRIITRGLSLLEHVLPVWNPNDGSIDMYHWYWGALATWQAGRKSWKTWAEALDTAVVSNQRKDTTYCIYRGSWDPIGPWGTAGGRIYSTALLALTLETPTRYARRFGR